MCSSTQPHSWTERVGTRLVALFAMALPFRGLGPYEVRDILPLDLSDIPLVVGGPVLLVWIVRHRRLWIRSGIPLAVLALCVAGAWSEMMRTTGLGLAWAVAKQSSMAFAVLAVTVAAARGYGRQVLAAACIGGAISVFVSLVGYVLVTLAGLQAVPGLFAFSSQHPIFDRLPRATGTIGPSPEHFGELLVALIALTAGWASADGRARWLARWLVGGAAALLTLTFSFAWIGGLVLSVGTLAKRLPRGRSVWIIGSGACILALAVASWAMNVGPPLSSDSELHSPQPCAPHYVSVIAGDPTVCHYSLRTWPYRRRATTYEVAKEASLAAITAHPATGVSHSGFGDFANQQFAEHHGSGATTGLHYTTPHGTFLGVPARSGLLGALALIALLVAIWRRRDTDPRNPRCWIWLGLVALLAIGVNIDVERLRQTWLLLGLTAGMPARSSEG